MQASDSLPQMYEDLADHYARRDEARKRDHCLVLAADAALRASQPDQAERLRKRLLLTNPHHLLKPFNSYSEAMESKDLQDYVEDLRRHWSPEVAEKLLRQLLVEADTPVEKEDFDTFKVEEPKASDPFVAKKKAKEGKSWPAKHSTLGQKDRPPPSVLPSTSGEFGVAMLLFVVGLVAAGGLLFVVFGLPLME